MTAPLPASRNTRRYGWLPDLPDQRDHLYAAPPPVLMSMPPMVDLRDRCPKEIYEQGELGSCTANAIAAAFEFDQLKQGIVEFMPSRLFIYYNERVMSNTVECDSGAQIRDGIKTVAAQGVCHETSWPYDIARFAQQPPQTCYQEALQNRAVAYKRVARTLNQLRGVLAEGYPFVFGFQVYESFEGFDISETGTVPMPGPGEQPLGGHAVLAVGYNDATQRFLIRNSWGVDWGDGGHFTLPYAYLTQRGLSSDFWAIVQVS
jgi:C1A family cysteine protease